MVGSASTTASAALLASHGQVSRQTAGVAVVLRSMASALISLSLIYEQTKHKLLTRRLTIISFTAVLLGLAVMLFVERLGR
jgi:uncharacterized membrane protein (DUF4010 family)